jgi:hypothetical protein
MTGQVLLTIQYSPTRNREKPYVVCIEGIMDSDNPPTTEPELTQDIMTRHKYYNESFETEELANAAMDDVVKGFIAACKEKWPDVKSCTEPLTRPYLGIRQMVVQL